jgi:hypothetical protein
VLIQGVIPPGLPFREFGAAIKFKPKVTECDHKTCPAVKKQHLDNVDMKECP